MAFKVSRVRSGQIKNPARPELRPVLITSFQLLVIMIVGLLAYSNTFHASFHLDDDLFIVGNPYIKDLRSFAELPAGRDVTVEYLSGALSANSFRERLIGYLSLALNYRLHGLDVMGYHIVNLSIHIINALLTYWLVLLTFRTPAMRRSISGPCLNGRTVAFFTSLLFVAHPVQTQAVTYITQRFASLATTFYLLSLALYVISQLSATGLKKCALYCVTLVSAVLAMKTKQISFTIPIMILLYDLIFFRGRPKDRLFRTLPILLTMLVIPASLIGTGRSVGDFIGGLDDATRVQTTISRLDYLLTEFRVIATYIRLLFFPFNQIVDYDYPIFHSFFDGQVFLSFMTIVSALGIGAYVLYRSCRRDCTETATVQCFRLVSFGIFWFFVTLSVESSVIPIIDVIFEHRVYLPSVGFSLALTSALYWAGQRMRGREDYTDNIIAGSLAIMVIVFTVGTYVRNIAWEGEMTLWTDVVRKSPLKERGHYHLAREYKKRGQLEIALSEYKKAASLDKNSFTLADTWNNIGRVYHRMGALDLAEDSYRTATGLNPHHSIAHNNLGLIYEEKHLADEAIREFRLSIKNNPDYAFAHFNLGRQLKKTGYYKEAEDEFNKAFQLGLSIPGMQSDAPSGVPRSTPDTLPNGRDSGN